MREQRRWLPWSVALFAIASFSAALALRDQLNPWLTTSTAAVISAALCVLVTPSRQRWAEFQARSALYSVAFGAALVLLTHLAYRVAISLAPSLQPRVAELYGVIDAAPGPVLGAPLIVIIAACEEIIWRGLILEQAQARFSAAKAAAISLALYAAPQVIGGSWVLVAAALGLGAIVTAQRLLTGRVSDAFITHAVWSVSVFSVFPLR